MRNLDLTRRCVGALAAAVIASWAVSAGAASNTYTLDADFDLGAMSGVNHDAPNNNQLQLSTVGTTFPVLWVANAGEDTLSKIDTTTGKELARYRTWFGPSGQPGYSNHLEQPWTGAAPSRSAVDIHGNAYILNRHFDGRPAMLMKVLSEGFIDRNGNSSMETSSDADNNGIISGAEIKNLADSNNSGMIDPTEIQDERIAWAVQVGAGNGLGRALCIGTDGNLWVGLYNAQQFYKVSSTNGSILGGPYPVAWQPYGCLVDGNGILWSASLTTRLGKLDTNNPSSTAYYDDSQAGNSNYGLALGNGKVYTATYSGYGFRQFDPTTNTFSTPGGAKNYASFGIGVDGHGNIWVGNQNPGGVYKYDSNGNFLCSGGYQGGGAETRGVIVDADNNIWQINRTNASVSKFNGATCAGMGNFPAGNQPYTYSDATGFAARNITTPTGTWTVIKNSGNAGQVWSGVSWTQSVPTGASVTVNVRASDQQANLSSLPWVPVTNGGNPGVFGQFIQVEARLSANTTGATPILYDLTLVTPDSICDVDRDGDIDSIDLGLISRARGQTPTANDPRDANRDGKIDPADVKVCTLRCTRTNCATQ